MSRGFAATGRFPGVGLGGADVQAYDLAPPFGVAGHGGYGRDGDDAPALALAQVGGVQISTISVDVIDTGREVRLIDGGDSAQVVSTAAAAEPLRIARKPARDRPDRL